MRLVRLAGVIFCLSCVTAACSPTRPSSIDQEVVLALGQTAPITAAAISLRFLGVPNDSRCPADALCVVAGSATVDVQVTAFSGAAQIVRFETGSPQSVRIGTLTLELVQLAPYPLSSQPINPADYRATLRVRR